MNVIGIASESDTYEHPEDRCTENNSRLHLRPVQLRVLPIIFQQFTVRSLLGDPPALHSVDCIGVLHRREPVRNPEDRMVALHRGDGARPYDLRDCAPALDGAKRRYHLHCGGGEDYRARDTQ